MCKTLIGQYSSVSMRIGSINASAFSPPKEMRNVFALLMHYFSSTKRYRVTTYHLRSEKPGLKTLLYHLAAWKEIPVLIERILNGDPSQPPITLFEVYDPDGSTTNAKVAHEWIRTLNRAPFNIPYTRQQEIKRNNDGEAIPIAPKIVATKTNVHRRAGSSGDVGPSGGTLDRQSPQPFIHEPVTTPHDEQTRSVARGVSLGARPSVTASFTQATRTIVRKHEIRFATVHLSMHFENGQKQYVIPEPSSFVASTLFTAEINMNADWLNIVSNMVAKAATVESILAVNDIVSITGARVTILHSIGDIKEFAGERGIVYMVLYSDADPKIDPTVFKDVATDPSLVTSHSDLIVKQAPSAEERLIIERERWQENERQRVFEQQENERKRQENERQRQENERLRQENERKRVFEQQENERLRQENERQRQHELEMQRLKIQELQMRRSMGNE
jgi:hypothetical protein